MSSIVEFCQPKYTESLARSEKVATGRRIIRFAELVSPRKAELANRIYAYARTLDDIVDESTQIASARVLLTQERSGLLKQREPTELQTHYLGELSNLVSPSQQEQITHHLVTLVKGLSIDANTRYSQKPLTNRQLRVRNYLDLWPNIAILSIGLAGKEPNAATPQIWDLMDAWGSYDILSDLTEDLKNGLILINREDMQKEGLSFVPNEVLPNDKLQDYYDRKRWSIMRSIRKNTPAILKTGLPIWMAVMAYMYFQRTQFKLLHPLRTEQDAVFKPPFDAKVRQ